MLSLGLEKDPPTEGQSISGYGLVVWPIPVATAEEIAAGYTVPVDPATLVECESCQ